jgi:type IV pilus assembly protein PilY1
MGTAKKYSRTAIASAIVAIYGVVHLSLVQAGPTIIKDEPLSTAGSPTPPNLMFILDDSGSMAQAYTPDYVQNVDLCRDIDGDRALEQCDWGDPIFSSASFNTQYYDPSITYLPGYDPALAAPAATPAYLGHSNMVNYNTPALWAAAQLDPYSSNTPNGAQNLVFGNTDVVYCSTNNPNNTQKFALPNTTCKDPVDTGVTPTAEAAGTGVWRYPNPRYGNGGSETAYVNRVSRTGTSGNPVAPYFYTISQVLFCINRNAGTTGTRPGSGNTGSKAFYGKGSLADATDKCNARRFNSGTNNFQYPRFGKIPYSSGADTTANNQQGSPTTNAADRWAGMSGFRRHNIVETSAGSNTLPSTYPSRADSIVYTNRVDCGFAACTYSQEMTNYANWFVYYRTRILMMKTAAGLAFYDMDDKFRVGFITINPGAPVSSTKYLPLKEFNSAQKGNWYSKFYGQTTGSSTPLRTALSRVGRHYAGKTDQINTGMGFATGSVNPQGNPDAVIASCQKNFALLTTDGYWNGTGGFELNGTTAMGDYDNSGPPPFFDGSGVQNTSSATSVGTLADVAMYYYINDLRSPVMVSGEDIWANNVPPSGRDTATWQHMTTFTLGLGLDGTLDYQSNYDATPPPPGDYADILSGAKDWPAPPSGGNEEKTLDDLWHAAVNGRGKFFSARNPNTLSASLSEALGSIQSTTGAGAAAATSNLQPTQEDHWAFTAEYQTVDWYGDVKARTIDLLGGIISKVSLWSARDLLDNKCTLAGCSSASTARSIYTFSSDTANFPNRLKAFTWTNGAGTAYPTDTNLTATEQAYFNPAQLTTSNLWDGSQLAASSAKSVVDYLRGDRTKEDTGGDLATDLYRARKHVLGDIISAQPVYIKDPPFHYTDNGYFAYQAAQANRPGTLYVAANDGMLHSFATDPDNNPYFQVNGITTTVTTDDTYSGTNDGGNERWAFIPTRVMPNLYKLAQKNYIHRWYVDGTPIVEDICVTANTATASVTTAGYTCPGATSWKAILVAGLNGGGRGYYALDISDPTSPKAMWEFNARDPSVTACAATTAAAIGASSDCDLGLTYGNPIITKLPLGHAQSGKWVVLISSGYDNYTTVDGSATNTGGDGNGYLYILDAVTGTIIEKIKTCSGTAGTAGASFGDANPCGFTKINTYHPLKNEKVDNSPVRVYGTTVTGELWRVDLTQQITPRAYLVATLKDPSGVVQPITTPPEMYLPTGLDTISYTNPWEAPAAVYVGTGRYLGTPDKTDLQHQTIYAIKDIPNTTTTLANARASLQTRTFQTEFTDTTSGQQRRTIAGATNNAFTASNGWYVDFPNVSGLATGERVNVDFRIVITTLVVLSNISLINSCVAGGTSWVNFIDVNTGGAVVGTTISYTSVKLPGSLGVGIAPIQVGGTIKTIVTTADNQQLTFDTPIAGSLFEGQRVQWRELTQ